MKDYKPLLNSLDRDPGMTIQHPSRSMKDSDKMPRKTCLKKLTQVLPSIVTKLVKNIVFLELEGIMELVGRFVMRTLEEENQLILWRGEENAPTDISNVILIEQSSFLLPENSFQCLEWDAFSNRSSRYWPLPWLGLVVQSDGTWTVKCKKNKILGNTKYEKQNKKKVQIFYEVNLIEDSQTAQMQSRRSSQGILLVCKNKDL